MEVVRPREVSTPARELNVKQQRDELAERPRGVVSARSRGADGAKRGTWDVVVGTIVT